MTSINKYRTAASIVVGVATGGFVGTIAKKLTPVSASFSTKVLTASFAVAGAGLLAWSGHHYGLLMVFGGFMKTAAIGTGISYALAAPGQAAEKVLQLCRGQTANKRYLNIK